ncbi:MAG TPA: glycosyltransferase [Pyrinomonadaceae bacterium]|nr:glycosyltransferase [Pyrinomonadaceae bacterium]
MPCISVIIPTHNRPRLIPQAVQSAIAAGSDIEVIVVDDASTDETADVCTELKGVKYVRLDRNQGVAGARNVGLMHAEGEYISFLDDDDLRLPGSLDLQAAQLDMHSDAGFVCGAMVMVDQQYQATGEITRPGHPSGDVFWHILGLDFPAMGLSTLIRKTCFLSIGLLHKDLPGIDDWDLLVRLAEVYPAVVINEPVGIYRLPTARSRQGSSSQAVQLNRLARHQLELLRLPRAKAAPRWMRQKVRRLAMNRIGDVLLRSAAKKIVVGELREASINIGMALHLNPMRALRLRPYRRLYEMWFAH